MKKILLTIALVAVAAMSYGQGTIQFVNGGTTKFKLINAARTATNDVPVGTQVNYAIFFGSSAATISQTPTMPFGAQGTSAGIMVATSGSGSIYPLPGTQPNDVVFAIVRGWSSSFGSDWRAAMLAWQAGAAGVIFGETDVRELEPLGASSGPGTPIWQSASLSDPNRFYALRLFESVPEPSVIALAVIGLGSLLVLRRRK